MKIITVHCTAKSDRKEELVALCRKMIPASRSEEGCLRYSFYKDLGADQSYFFYEEWTDQQAIDRHNTSAHFLDFQPRFRALIDGEPAVKVYTVAE